MGNLQGPFQGAVIFLPRVAIAPKLLPTEKPPSLARLDGFLANTCRRAGRFSEAIEAAASSPSRD
jgi:hypothetical protein